MAGQPPKVIVAPRAKQGSFAALAASYFASTAYLTMKPSTRGIYNNAIGRLCKSKDKNGTAIGTLGAATLRREHVVALMAARAEKPDSANLSAQGSAGDDAARRRDWACEPDDPTRDVKAIRVKSDGYP